MPVLNPRALVIDRVEAIRSYHERTRQPRATLDVSGGADSCGMACLLVLALGPENVTFDHTAIDTNPVQTERARHLIKAIGGKLAVSDFTQVYDTIVDKVVRGLIEAGYDAEAIYARMGGDPTVLGSIRSTLRAPLGRAYNRLTGGGIRHGTGNECEDRWTRFFQKGGDGEVDTNPIAMLSKAEVYQMLHELATGGWFANNSAKDEIFEHIRCVPSADLWANGDAHNDEDELSRWLGAKFTYGRLDCATGRVLGAGTIERVSRFLDEAIPDPFRQGRSEDQAKTWQERLLFTGEGEPIEDEFIDMLAEEAARSNAFRGSDLNQARIGLLLRGARKAEAATRHKMNPNIPTLGSREVLLGVGILTDDLSAYGA